MRTSSPADGHVRRSNGRFECSSAERQRGVFYMLAPFFDHPRDEADAMLAERLYGDSRGRSRTARGALPLPPHENFGRHPLTPGALRAGVEAADDLTFAYVGAMLHSFFTLAPALMPIFIPADSQLRSFAEGAVDLLKSPPPHAIGLIASALVANAHRRRTESELTEEHLDAAQLPNLFHQIYSILSPEQRRQLTGSTP